MGMTLAASCLFGGRAHAVEIDPLYSIQVLGGQYFFSGDRGALSGNVAGLIAPAMKINESWALLPSLSSSYRGTKQVVDLVGSGSIVQEEMKHRVGVKAIYADPLSKWRIKPMVSFSYELLKETKDETWSSGLFDYYKWNAGIELEYVYYEPFSIRYGLDFYEARYPNYTSLESQAALNFEGQDLARELVGDRILDTRNIMASFYVDGPLTDRFIISGGITSLYQMFYRQPLVDLNGELTSVKRHDLTTYVRAGIKMPKELNTDLRILLSLDTFVGYNNSNQHSYDAQRTKFIKFFYNYGEVKAVPSFKLYVGPIRKPVILNISGTWYFRRYPYRVTQDSNGVYQQDQLKTHNWMFTTSLTYPMAPKFSLLFNFQYGKSSSNQRFEQFYSYNYTVANYLMGFRYAY